MLDHVRLAKVLALAGSDADGEALAALRKVSDMLRAENLSLTHLAQWIAAGPPSSSGTQHLRRRVATVERLNSMLQARISDLEIEIHHLRSRPANRSQSLNSPSLRRSRAEISDAMHAVFADPVSDYLSDREIARRTGLSPQTVGNWRRRLEAERRDETSHVHCGRRRR